ncbi:hypothetical protein GOARA_011_00140 [Gordonia araii NBRC 100433]|uniref:Ribonuclease VapC n=1 Tax=Gordonia araii NBRC 100433 TaxID=1073574 RepID=G7GXS3_9ACTN|nr:type II toxin-antitoxin system VapC family toxin [Gordonia araii]NNG98406.1 type II toxin-antitoxin system VapC family toxin [Gordonia araii NBRC 100433]GAB08398.1 hypothetical protein GOARA_011_00140 [Gordonia araii NBRC 100433]
MIVLDAAILIAHLGVEDPHAEAALEILDTEERLAIHPLSLAEVLVHPARSGTESQTLEVIEKLGIEQVSHAPGEPVELARIRAATGLKMPDCCVLVAAEREASSLATFDRRLGEVARNRGVNVVGC